MATCVYSVLDRFHPHSCSPACNPTVRIESRIRNALQSLANCAFLVARDPGVAPEHIPLLSQMQADVATVNVLLRKLKSAQMQAVNFDLLINLRRNHE